VPVVWKTNGFLTPEALDLVAPALAAVNIDVKGADDDRHRRLTGAPLGPVLDAVRRFHGHGVWVEVATPLVPGVSDGPDDLRRIAATIAAVDERIPWHLLRFTPTFRLARRDPTGPDELARAVDIGRAAGLRHVYVERALGPAGRATRCPDCSTELITRDVWGPVRNGLVDGACPGCGTRPAGRW
jgi:pyruvate formate lyase activating enzyme